MGQYKSSSSDLGTLLNINGMDHGTTQLLVDPYSIINAFLIDFRNKCPSLGNNVHQIFLWIILKNESWIGVRLIFRDEARSAFIHFLTGKKKTSRINFRIMR